MASSPVNNGCTPPTHWSAVMVVGSPPLYDVKSMATSSAKIER